MTKKIFILFLGILISSQVLFPQEKIDSSLLYFKKETWNLGVSRFRGTNLEKQNDYLKESLPLMLLEDLSDIKNHTLSEQETDEYTIEYINDQILKIKAEKSQLHKQKDSLIFSDLQQKDRLEKYRTLEEKITKNDTLIGLWQELNSDEIKIKKEIPLLFQKYTDDQEKLSDPWSQKKDFMNNENLDLLITGSIERLDNLFILNVSCFSRFSDVPVLELEKTGTEEELNSLLNETSDSIRSIVLGRSWSELSIDSNPEKALIILDGETVGVGSFHSKILDPGFVTMTIKSSGFVSYSTQVYLAAEDSTSRQITLDPGITETLTIYSDPPEADVYLGALWIGKTPLTTTKPVEQEMLKVFKKNFMPFIQSTDKLISDNITVRLSSSLYDRKQRLKESKSAFYKSLGWFSLSIGVPLILSGIYQNLDNRYYNYAVDFNSTGNPDSYDKAREYRKYADISYYSFWGGIALSGSLFINTLFKLRNFIVAAEESTEE